MKYNTPTDVITEAAHRGSTATTYAGARRWLLNHLTTAPHHWYRQRASWYGSRAEWAKRDHDRRLCARYVGMTRLPKYLSEADRATIAAHPANTEYTYLQTLPPFVRAFYINHTRDISRISAFIHAADREKGELREWAEIAYDAYTRYDWGRLQVRSTGGCVTPDRVGILQTGSNTDWNKRSTLRRYAEYSLIAPREHGNVYAMYYVDASHHVHTVKASSNYYRIDGGTPKRHTSQKPKKITLNVHTQRRILAAHVPAVISVDYDRNGKRLMLVDSTGEQYHLNYVPTGAHARNAVREAVAALRKRRAKKIAVTNPERVWVQVEDSYESGNCRSMTDEFVRDYLRQIGATGPVCTRGDLLLSIRDDAYTRRAVAFASQRLAA